MDLDCKEASQRLAEGQVVALPTETVYGLAADASNLEAVRQVFALKGRPLDHPLIVHLAEASWAGRWAHLPEAFEGLARRFWPGPLTLVLPRRRGVDDLITGGQDTVALRVPRHPMTLEVLQLLGRAVVAPSANQFGHTSPTCAEHVRQEFGADFPVLDGGPCQVGVESTILDLSGARPRVLRPGQLSRQELEGAGMVGLDGAGESCGPVGSGVCVGGEEVGAALPRVPGSLERHYAPRTATHFDRHGVAVQGRWGWLGFSSRSEAARQILMPADPEGYGRSLYAALRQLDREGLELILVEPPPQSPEWEAIWDRLRRACQS